MRQFRRILNVAIMNTVGEVRGNERRSKSPSRVSERNMEMSETLVDLTDQLN